MADNVAGPVVLAVELRTQHSSQIANANLHCVSHCSLRLARDVDGRPGEREGSGREDATGGEEGACVGDTRAGNRVGVGQENDVSDDGKESGADDEDGAFVQPLREDGDPKGGEEGKGVGWNGKQLRVGGCVAQSTDDGWL